MEPGARALLHANQPSLRLPAALSPSSRLPPPRSLLPPAALPPFLRARRRRPLPAPSLSRASFPPLASGTQPPPPPPRPSLAGGPRAATRGPLLGPGPHARRAPPVPVRPGPGVTDGPRFRFQVLEKRPGNLHGRVHLLSAGGLHALGSKREPDRIQDGPRA